MVNADVLTSPVSVHGHQAQAHDMSKEKKERAITAATAHSSGSSSSSTTNKSKRSRSLTRGGCANPGHESDAFLQPL